MRLVCKRCHSWVEISRLGADELADIIVHKQKKNCPDCGAVMNEVKKHGFT